MKDEDNVSAEQNAANNDKKVYVQVNVDFYPDGAMEPRQVIWKTGRIYKIAETVDIKQAPALKAGGQGDRYTVIIHGQQSYLYFERSTNLTGNVIGRWFVERRDV